MEIVTINGGFRIPKDDCIGKWCYESGKLCHDEFLPYCIDPYIKSGDTIIDIGANIGSHTIHYSEQAGHSGRVLAIEPGRIAYDCLEHNAKLFRFQNVITANYGCSDIPSLGNHIENRSNLGASSCVEVKAMGEIILCPLDFLVKIFALDEVDFIKIDAEGFEFKILKGAIKTLTRFKPTLLIEINEAALHRAGSSSDEVFDLLEKLGYQFFCVNLGLSGADPQYDIICQRIHSLN